MIWHCIIKTDRGGPLPVVFHECDAHLRISGSLCDDLDCICNLTPPTLCNCRKAVPCTRCTAGETPAMTEAIVNSLQVQVEP